MMNVKSKLLLVVFFQMWLVTFCEAKEVGAPSEHIGSVTLAPQNISTSTSSPSPTNITTTASPPTTPNTTTTTTTPSTPTTKNTTTTTTTPSTPITPNTTTTSTTIAPAPNSTTTVVPTTMPTPITTTTVAPKTTPKPQPDRKFDGPSFIGGMILTMGLMAIAFVAWKFYKARTERNYHTL